MKLNSRIFLLLGVLCFLLCLTGCSGFDSLTGTILAVLGSINVVLATIQTAFPTAVVAAIESAVSIAEGAVTALKAAYNDFLQNKTGAGVVDALKAAIKAVQDSLAQLEAAAHIDNPALQSLISKVVTLIGAVLDEVANAIVPQVPAMMEAHSKGDDKLAIDLNERMKVLAAKLKADSIATIDASGLPADATDKAKSYIHHHTEHFIGPVRV